jgi:hypothetical protein
VYSAALGSSQGLGTELLHIYFRPTKLRISAQFRVEYERERESEEKWIQKRLKFQGIPTQTNPVVEYLIWLWILEVILPLSKFSFQFP